MSKKTLFFAFDDGYNTSYIDSLLIGLFYDINQCANLLTNNPKTNSFYYVQEMIKHDIMDAVHSNYSISYSKINEFRNFIIACGWKHNENIVNLHNVVDLYGFLIENIGCGELYYDIFDVMLGSVLTHKVNHIECSITEDKSTSVNSLLQVWKDKNININKIKFINFPEIIPIYINRSGFLNVHVDITKGIKICNVSYNNMVWYASTIICFSNAEKQYYSVLRLDKEWYFFSNKNIPAMIKINIRDNITAKKIQTECVLIFYVFNKIF